MSPKEGRISAGSHGTTTRVLIPSHTYYRRTLPYLTPSGFLAQGHYDDFQFHYRG